MPHVVTQSCCADASCVHACPVNCIHPTPDEPGFGTTDMVYVDPASCVDCGACVSACPVGAIQPHTKLTDAELPFIDLNAAFHREPVEGRPLQAPVPRLPRLHDARRVEVVVVGAGPAAIYTVAELVKNEQVHVTVLERLDVLHGLARFGISPDHERTQRVRHQLDRILAHPRVTVRTGVEVGRDVSLDDLRADHDAVVMATGAWQARPLPVPGAELPGVVSAFDLVTWWNGHPEAVQPTLDAERVVVVGAGNVALDVARMLTAPPEVLAGLRLSDAVRDVLAASPVRHVDLVARSSGLAAAFTTPELVGLAGLRHASVRVEGLEPQSEGLSTMAAERWRLLDELASRTSSGERSITLRLGHEPVAVTGQERASGLTVSTPGGIDDLPAGLIVAAVGQRAVVPAGVPVDTSGVLVQDRGRIIDPLTGAPEPGLYCVGWLKRGGRGFIGTNRACARETTRAVLEDVAALTPTP